ALTEDRMAGWLVREGPSREEMNPVRFLDLEAGWVGAVSAEGTDWTVVYCHIAGNPVNRET
ncbi:MAG: hypothetical protein NZM29_06060, partial [Nitrospira sp.]|nr:hypothetical protein [Nitrospira sp.]